MSTTTQTTTTTTTGSTILEKVEAEGRKVLTAVEHAALWLVGKAALVSQSLHDLVASDPIVAEGVTAGTAWAEAHGIPVKEGEVIAEDVLTAAKQLAAGLAQPAPAAATTSGTAAGAA